MLDRSPPGWPSAPGCPDARWQQARREAQADPAHETRRLLTVLQRFGQEAIDRGARLRSANPDTAAPAAPALPPGSRPGKLGQRLKAGD